MLNKQNLLPPVLKQFIVSVGTFTCSTWHHLVSDCRLCCCCRQCLAEHSGPMYGISCDHFVPTMHGCSATHTLQVVLPQLPSAVAAVIQQHNEQVLQLLIGTLQQRLMQPATTADSNSGTSLQGSASCADQQLQQELCLPLSGCSYSTNNTSTSTGSDKLKGGSTSSPLFVALAASCVPAVLVSPFMAMCGAGDAFASLSELLLAGRQWLRLHRGGVPLLALQDRRGQDLAVNAWALDYFKHGQK